MRTLDPNRANVHQRAMSDTTPDSLIPYDEIAQEALRGVIPRVLSKIGSNESLPGAHHFYISFMTNAPGVSIPRHLHERFPEEMTVVLQNKFWGLKVSEEGFEVGLTFNQIGSTLYIPFAAITRFVDPAVEFGLDFQVQVAPAAPAARPAAVPVEDGSNVVAVDFGRKK
jgi:uncharacterized protein